MRAGAALAWRILVHDKKRFCWSVLGISFAVLLMFVEMGFYRGSYDSITLPLERLDADLLMFSRMKEDMFPPEPFARARLAQAYGFPGVEAAHPLYMFIDAMWKNARDGRVHPIRVFAFDPAHRIWKEPAINEAVERLKQPGTCLLDAASRDRFGSARVGQSAELAGRRVRIVGTYELGPDLVIDGTALMSSANFATFFHGSPEAASPLEEVEFGVIRLEPGADPRAVARAMERELPDDVSVTTPGALVDRVHAYWQRHQPVGTVFLTGLVVGFVIGVMICYQVLFTEIADNLAEYATLKAIGYRDRFIVATVLRQGAYLSLVGFAGGTLAAALVYRILEAVSALPMPLTPGRGLLVFAATVAMCLTAASIAVRKVLRSDPAEVFR